MCIYVHFAERVETDNCPTPKPVTNSIRVFWQSRDKSVTTCLILRGNARYHRIMKEVSRDDIKDCLSNYTLGYITAYLEEKGKMKGIPEKHKPALVVIDVLRQMILAPDDGPEQWSRQLQSQGQLVTAGQVRQVVNHYALKKNGGSGLVRPAARSPTAGHGATPAGRGPARRCALSL